MSGFCSLFSSFPLSPTRIREQAVPRDHMRTQLQAGPGSENAVVTGIASCPGATHPESCRSRGLSLRIFPEHPLGATPALFQALWGNPEAAF